MAALIDKRRTTPLTSGTADSRYAARHWESDGQGRDRVWGRGGVRHVLVPFIGVSVEWKYLAIWYDNTYAKKPRIKLEINENNLKTTKTYKYKKILC